MKLLYSTVVLFIAACQFNTAPLPELASEELAEWIETHECTNVEYRLWSCEWPTRMFIFAPPSD